MASASRHLYRAHLDSRVWETRAQQSEQLYSGRSKMLNMFSEGWISPPLFAQPRDSAKGLRGRKAFKAGVFWGRECRKGRGPGEQRLSFEKCAQNQVAKFSSPPTKIELKIGRALNGGPEDASHHQPTRGDASSGHRCRTFVKMVWKASCGKRAACRTKILRSASSCNGSSNSKGSGNNPRHGCCFT